MALRYYVSSEEAPFFVNNKMGSSDRIPTSGTYKVGDFIISNTQADGIFGWVCTVAGTPGTWIEIGSGGGSNTKTLSLSSSTVVSSPVREVTIGIKDFNKNTDFLMVYKNSTYLTEGVDYDISSDSTKIVSRTGNWNADSLGDYRFSFVVIKEVEKVNPKAVVGTENIKDNVVTMSKLGEDVKERLDGFDSQLEHIENEKVLNLLDYKTDTNTWNEAMLQACEQASKYANGIVEISNGIYTMNEIDIPIGVTVIGRGSVIIKPEKSDTYIFKVNRQATVSNVTLTLDREVHTNITGIIVDGGSRSVLRDIDFIYLTTGIEIENNSYCVSVENADFYVVHKGIKCNGSGHRISIKCLSGDAGYTDTVANGSIGIEFIGSHNTILDGGQIDSCEIGILCVGTNNTIGNIWIEHCITGITGTEANLKHIYGYNRISLQRVYTPNGINKSFSIHQLSDSAFNTNNMYSHYVCNKIEDNRLYDYSGNANHVSIDSSRFTIDNGTYGNCLKSDTTASSFSILDMSTIESDVVNIVVNYNVSEIEHSNPRRVIAIEGASNFFISSNRGNSIYYSHNNVTWLRPAPNVYNEDNKNRVLSLEINFKTKKMYLIYVHTKYEIPIPSDDVDAFFENVKASRIVLGRSWVASNVLTYNYIYVFEKELDITDILNFNNMTSHVYNQSLIQSMIEKMSLN